MIYKAMFDVHNNYNDAPLRCKDCNHNYFRISCTAWICDACGSRNPADRVRAIRYKEIKAQKRLQKRKRKNPKPEATELDGLDMF